MPLKQKFVLKNCELKSVKFSGDKTLKFGLREIVLCFYFVLFCSKVANKPINESKKYTYVIIQISELLIRQMP